MRDKFAKGSGPYAEFFPQGLKEDNQACASVAATRSILKLQLGRNILAIASHHLGQPERAADYFNQSLLEDATRNNDDTVTPPPVV